MTKKLGGKPPAKQTSSNVSTIASGILSGNIPKPTTKQIKTVAASALSQDQKKGQGKR
jgi:hypothetical protein